MQLQGKIVYAEEYPKSWVSSPEKVDCQKKSLKNFYFFYFLQQNLHLETVSYVHIFLIMELLFILDIQYI